MTQKEQESVIADRDYFCMTTAMELFLAKPISPRGIPGNSDAFRQFLNGVRTPLHPRPEYIKESFDDMVTMMVETFEMLQEFAVMLPIRQAMVTMGLTSARVDKEINEARKK